jgi:hypothetical protein
MAMLVAIDTRITRSRLYESDYIFQGSVFGCFCGREAGSDRLNEFFIGHHPFYITSICFAEALGVLKRRMKKKRVSRDDYFRMCFGLIQLTKDDDLQIEDPDAGNVYVSTSRRK